MLPPKTPRKPQCFFGAFNRQASAIRRAATSKPLHRRIEMKNSDRNRHNEDGQKHGHWVNEFADGCVEEGKYVDGKPHGRWVSKCPKGNMVEGCFINGKRDGYWVWQFTNGSGAEGRYVNGQVHGIWIFRYSNGKSEEVRYEHGVEVRNGSVWPD